VKLLPPIPSVVVFGLLILAQAAFAQNKEKEPDKATVAAFEKIGGVYGRLLRHHSGWLEFSTMRETTGEGVLAFRFTACDDTLLRK
jgi:hypothetical protein